MKRTKSKQASAAKETAAKETTIPSSYWWPTAASLLGIFLLLMVIYSPALAGPLAFDDFNLLAVTPEFPPSLSWHRPETRPLVMLLFSIENQFASAKPIVLRVTNILIHTFAVVLFFQLVLRLALRSKFSFNDARWVAGFAALLWAVHPLQTESVAYIIQRSEALMGMFYFAYLLCLVLDQESLDRVPRNASQAWLERVWHRKWLVLSLGCFLCGLWSKTIMTTALAVGPLMDRGFLSDSWRQVLVRRGWVSAIMLLCGGIAVLSLLPGLMRGDANVGFGGDAPPARIYFAAQTEVLWRYVALAFMPNNLSIDHGMRAPLTVSDQWPWIVMSGLWLFAGATACLRGFYRAGFLLLAPILVLSPTSSFIPTADLYVEHRTYVPLAIFSVAVALACTPLCEWIKGRRSNKTSWNSLPMRNVLAGMLLIMMAGRTYIRAADYESGFRLWSQAVLLHPDNDRAIQNMIDASVRENTAAFVIPTLQKAIQKCDSLGCPPTVPLQRLGEEYLKLGQSQSAISALQRAIELDNRQLDLGGYRDVHRDRDRAAMHVNYALALMQSDRSPEASEQIERAFEFSDYNPQARALAGQISASLGDTATARDHFERALELQPVWPEVRHDLQVLDGM